MEFPTENKLRFNLNAEEINELSDTIIEETKQTLDKVAAIEDGNHTFENTVLAISYDEARAHINGSMCDFPQYVMANDDVRDASAKADAKLRNFGVECSMRKDVYESLRKFSETDEAKNLDRVDSRLLKKMMLDFERNGLNLEDDKRDTLKEVQKEISSLCIEFQKNLNEDKTTVEFMGEDLEGMSDDFKSGLKVIKEYKHDTVYEVTMKYPHLFPILKNATKASTRETMELANARKVNETNVPILEKIIKLRQQEAELLGYPNHCGYILEIRMAKDLETVKSFLEELREKLIPKANEELEVLGQLKEKTENDSNILSHYFRYYHEMNLKENYSVDEDTIKNYFPIEKVIQGMLEVYEVLFSVKFTKIDNPHVWHEDVSMYAVNDSDSGEFMGHFYLDLFPRDNKYGHAAAFPLCSRAILEDGSLQYPVSAMVANFTKPTNNKPSLLKFNETVTAFHELGHVLHGMFTKVKYSRFSGTSVERDFVEAPSQLLENWCYESEVLSKISGHYETNEPLPQNYVDSLVNAKNADTGLLNLRQIFFATFDIEAHSSGEEVDTEKLWYDLRKSVALIPQPENTNPSASFGHITGGYSSSYYSYLYSEVFAADLFAKFKEEGIFSKDTGKRYRDIVLSRGGSEDSINSLKEFLGREPNQINFLKHIGLTE
eukprot:TRINITY_DN5214_c5_g3_i1.p1 TRINITY_DN5214_c5_g3~~TRINITY_DN5214_c5_g3_i1.p1  ORF type:complete len:663 (+),score=254.49 TRINITY_DN5214_c5_g3_i1:1-1989(+)